MPAKKVSYAQMAAGMKKDNDKQKNDDKTKEIRPSILSTIKKPNTLSSSISNPYPNPNERSIGNQKIAKEEKGIK